ncbi:Membrane-bound lytic murein transglycosylase D precursor [compost metagenome]
MSVTTITTSTYQCIYTSVEGDTLTSIARTYRVRPFDLLVQNEELAFTYSLASSLAQGTKVAVPCVVSDIGTSFTPCTYIFRANDTINTAASALGVTTDELIYYQSNGNGPQIGSVVTASGCFNSVNNTYITRQGDTLEIIADKFQVPLAQLVLVNSITGSQAEPLPPGLTLTLPRIIV